MKNQKNDKLDALLELRGALRMALPVAERLSARHKDLNNGIAPTIFTDRTPWEINSINPLELEELPRNYLLSTPPKNLSAQAANKVENAHRINAYVDASRDDFENNLRLMVGGFNLNDYHQGKNNFIKAYLAKIKVKFELARNDTRIFVVGPEIAKNAHLFDYVRQGDKLIITLKENLHEAEFDKWHRDNGDFQRNLYAPARRAAAVANRLDLDIMKLSTPLSREIPPVMNIERALQELQTVEAQVKVAYTNLTQKLTITRATEILARPSGAASERG